MKRFRIVVAVLSLLSLSACYTSKEPLIADDAVADHASLTFLGEGDDAKPMTFTRDGNSYVTDADGEEARLHLKPVQGDYYVAQLNVPGDEGLPQILYAFMRLDVNAGVADTWLSVGTEADVRPGLSECDDVICIDDLAAYIAYGQEKIAAGAPPDTTFKVNVE
jgi:hypothetical protein